MSLGMMVTRLAWMAHKLVSSQRPTKYASDASYLQSQDGGGLEAQVGLEVLGDLTHQALEGQFADEQLGGLLVLADLTESHGTRPVAMGLLHATGGGGGLVSRLGGELLARGLASGGLAGSLLGTSHCYERENLLGVQSSGSPSL
jgi:hypothetical protein